MTGATDTLGVDVVGLWLLVSRLVLAAITELLPSTECVSVVAIADGVEIDGATRDNPEMEKLPPFRVESVLDSDDDKTLVVLAT